MTNAQLMKQIAEARRSMKALAKLYPGAFDKNGRAIVAVAAFPRRTP
jgi:hypothetical protein